MSPRRVKLARWAGRGTVTPPGFSAHLPSKRWQSWRRWGVAKGSRTLARTRPACRRPCNPCSPSIHTSHTRPAARREASPAAQPCGQPAPGGRPEVPAAAAVAAAVRLCDALTNPPPGCPRAGARDPPVPPVAPTPRQADARPPTQGSAPRRRRLSAGPTPRTSGCRLQRCASLRSEAPPTGSAIGRTPPPRIRPGAACRCERALFPPFWCRVCVVPCVL